MANVIRLRKGLDIHLQGKAEETKMNLKSNGHYALVPDDFEGVVPKVVVREGDVVRAGDALFVNKLYPEVRFASPVSGKVTAVERGERRKVLCVKVEADSQQQYVDFGKKDVPQWTLRPLLMPFLRQVSLVSSKKDVELTVFEGKCPAGNVGVQVNHIDPVNKGEVVWTIGDPTVVLFIGRLFNTGKVNLTRTVALCGSEVKKPCYVDMLVGEELSTLLSNSYDADHSVRIINGNVLTGRITSKDGFLGAHTSEITVIPEGDDNNELLGWIMPRFGQFSVNRSYFSWLFGKKQYALDARVKGGERHMIMSGEYDKVLPMDIYGEYLIKAIIAGDIDKMEQLGIYEVAPEDFALAEFVDSSKLELQRIVREGLNNLRKENA